MEERENWSIHEAVAVSHAVFVRRFGEDVLWMAFNALTSQRDATLAEHARLERDIDKYLQYTLHSEGGALAPWLTGARDDPETVNLLLHIGVRWWLARDDLLSRPARSRVPCVYAQGLKEHVSLQLLAQMLYRGRAPYTTCD